MNEVINQLPPEHRTLNADQEEAIKQLEELASDIERKKDEVRKDAESAAKDALDRLSRKDARRFELLIRERCGKLNEEATEHWT